ATAGPGTPYLDLGLTTLPLYQGWLEPVLSLKKTADPQVLPVEGGTTTFVLEVETHGPSPVTNVDITDTLPISWTYVAGSTIVTYPDGSKGYPEPTINGRTLFWNLSHELYTNQTLRLEFDARIQTGGSVGATRSDDFEDGQVYNGGTNNWTGPWSESDDGSASTGDLQIIGPDGDVDPYAGDWQLRLRDDNVSIERSANLSGFARPMLRFKRNAYSLDNNNEHFYLDIYDGSAWHTGVLSWTDGSQEDIWVQEEIDLSPYAATTTTIRFSSPAESKGNGDRLYIDDVEIYDAAAVNQNQGQVVGQYRSRTFNATDTAVVYISALSLEKEADRSTAEIGATIAYTLTYRNSGGVTTTNTYINDTLPGDVTFSNASSGGVYISATNTISWTIPDVGPSKTGTVTFTVTVDDDTPDGTVIENLGRINSEQTGLVNSNVARVTVLAPDLEVTKSGPGNASEGEVITYTIQYANNGGAAATGVLISDTIPTSTTYRTGSMEIDTGSGWVSLTDDAGDDAGVYNAGVITVRPGVTSGTVATGESGAIRFSVQIDSSLPDGTIILNQATFDRDGANPQSTAIVATPISDLTIEKATDQTVAVAGDVIEYTLNYANHGAVTENDIYIYDTIPEPATYVSGTVTGAGLTIEYSIDHRATWTTTVPTDPTQVTDLRWSRATLSPGATGTAGFHVQLPQQLPGDTTLSNFATITSTGGSLIHSNIVDIKTIDLVIKKVTSSSYAFPGDTITYTITYGNNGSANATGVTITDTVPVSVTYVPSSITGAGADDSSAPDLVWNVGTVVAGARDLQATFVVTVPSGATPGDNIVNTATISNSLDSATSGESKVTVASAGVTIGPDHQTESAAGETITYTHDIINTGNVSDTFTITYSHSLWVSATTTLYHDQDGDGVRDPDDPIITTTTGVVQPGQEYDLLLVLTVPANAGDGVTNRTTITATSNRAPANSSSAVDTTNIPDEPIAGLTIADDTGGNPVQINSSVAFTGSVSAGSNVVYSWNFGDGITTTGQTASHAFANPGTYTVTPTGTHSAGSSVTTTTVTVIDEPIAGLSIADDTGGNPVQINSSVAFTGSVSAGSNVVYSWNFGDGITATG
ncbi:MAG: hypothetical protein DRP90_06845, partial [Planctomycetota bacterium]